MTQLAMIALGVGVAAAWLGMLAYLRMKTPLERLHVVAFVNVVTGGMFVLAAWLADGASGRTLKCTAMWLTMLLVGSLSSHVTGRAINLRSGERR